MHNNIIVKYFNRKYKIITFIIHFVFKWHAARGVETRIVSIRVILRFSEFKIASFFSFFIQIPIATSTAGRPAGLNAPRVYISSRVTSLRECNHRATTGGGVEGEGGVYAYTSRASAVFVTPCTF